MYVFQQIMFPIIHDKYQSFLSLRRMLVIQGGETLGRSLSIDHEPTDILESMAPPSIENLKTIGPWAFLTHILLKLSFTTQCMSLTHTWTLANPPSSEFLPYCKLSLKWKHLIVHYSHFCSPQWHTSWIQKGSSAHLDPTPNPLYLFELVTRTNHQLWYYC